MEFIKWTNDYSVDIQSIDDQHKTLFVMINDYYEAVRQKQSNQGLKILIGKLLNYTNFHFKNEERYFDKFLYSQAESHKKLHQVYISKIEEVKNRLENNKMVLPVEVGTFLRDWLYQHIKVEDKKYSAFLKEKGIK
ncbi:MAG: hemerythrin family protein [Bacteroidales bacterium]|nr:hemerythrin family protein [Bacteroidales bacterium]MBN2756096.1 hemerythrin family protein [Bacteroidales bacterium]